MSAGGKNKGFVLIFIVIAVVLATIFAGALYTAAFLNSRLSMQVQNGKLAYYAAVSGVEYARYLIDSTTNNPNRYNLSDYTKNTKPPYKWPLTNTFDPSGGAISGMSVTVNSITASVPDYIIVVDGQYSSVHKILTVKYSLANGITSWQISG